MKLPIIIFLFATLSLNAQVSLQDSLLTALKTSPEDTNRVNGLHLLAGTYWGTNLDQAEAYALKALDLANKLGYEIGRMKAYYKLGATIYFKGNLKEAEKHIQKALQIATDLDIPIYIGANVDVLSSIYQDQGKYTLASEIISKNIERQKAINDHLGIGISYSNLANIYGKMEQKDNAKKYTLLSIEQFEKTDPRQQAVYLAQIYINLGTYEQEDSMAIIQYKKAVEFAEPTNNQSVIAHSNSNIGEIYLRQEKYELALAYFSKAQKISETVGISNLLTSANNSLAFIYSKLNKASEAIELLEKNRQYCLELGLIKEQMEANMSLAELYGKQKDYQKAYTFLQEGTLLYDSLYQKEHLTITAELDAKYERKQQEAALAQQKLELTEQKNLRNQIIIAALVLLFGGLVFFQWLLSKQKRKKQMTELALVTQQAESKRLKEMDLLKSNFFANISHEFRTPLTLIIAPLRDLIAGKTIKNPSSTYKMMLRNGERLLELINQLLDLSKLEAGKLQLQASEQNMNQWIRPIFYAFESLADTKQIDYQLHLPKESVFAWIDQDKMEKVITNLLSNAFKFTPEEGQIQLSIAQKEEQLLFKVSDNGLGIPKEKLPSIFNRFFQIDDSSTKAYEGTGIGLALVKELVDLHQGKIEVESAPNKGTHFTISLPLGARHLKEPEKVKLPPIVTASKPSIIPTEVSDHKTTTSPNPPNTPIVLIVEDNADIRQYISETLEGDYQIITAANGKIGVETAKKQVPDLIISDVMMPEMDGTMLTKQLKTESSTSHIPIILLTARAERADKLLGLKTGADDYLVKPFDKIELQQRVHNLIQQRKLLREKYSQSIYISQSPKAEENTNPEDRFIQKVISIIENNMEDESFGVEELSQALFLSRFQLHRKIKALTNKSISVFIRSIRLQHAKSLLENGKGNVSEIAFRLGFNSVAYFSKCFNDEFGLSPSKVKRN
jgi:signal transduction histidine kinase/DNA-binding response OmpR family regulator